MDDAALLRASARERALYDELAGVYRALLDALADPATPVDPDVVGAHRQRAEGLVDALRAVAATLAPRRLAGTPVADQVTSLWRASARAAATALGANRELEARVRARGAAIAERLVSVDRGRRALASYRPVAASGSASA
jgi:hypothetical protein